MGCDDQQSGQREVFQACGRGWRRRLPARPSLRSRAKAEQRYGVQVKAIVIQEAGLDGFWIYRLLLASGIESHVVDAASIAVDRRHRRAKTDAMDGETLLRTLMAWARGERRVCSMVRAPSAEEEDRRRLTRERGTLLKERIQRTNRVRGLLSGQGIGDYDPLRRDRFERLEALRTGDGRELPPRLKAEIRRELDRIALVTTQLARSNALATGSSARTPRSATTPPPCFSSSKAWALSSPRSSGWNSCFAASATDVRWRLTAAWRPVPGRAAASNGIRASRSRESPLAQDDDELPGSGCVTSRTGVEPLVSDAGRRRKGRIRRIAIVALARKLLVALWRYVTHGVVPEGAVFKRHDRENNTQRWR